MARVMEIFVIVNAACGVAAFLLARGGIKWVKRQFGIAKPDPEDRPKELP